MSLVASRAEPLLSPDWYRIAYLVPQLRPGIDVSQQWVRSERWYVLTDSASGRHYRFNETAYLLIRGCDGVLTIDEIWSGCVTEMGDHAPTQAEAIQIFAQAFNANLFIGNLEVDAHITVGEQRRRAARRRRAGINPLAFRMPLWDPDEFLSRHVHRVRWLFARASIWSMLAIIMASLGLLLVNGAAFADYAIAHLGSGSMLLMLWLVFPLIKGMHEMAHAFAVKRYGGQVHEMGITLLMMTPVPYVDASASTAFRDKWDRVRVAAAGIFVEAVLASLALPLWLLAEPGPIQALGFAVVFAGLLSTLLVNGNPLLRFDGYYVLCDVMETPNLATRSQMFWKALLKRRVAGLPHARFSGMLRGERPWLLAFAPLSWLYRLVLISSVALLLARWSSWLGLAMFAFGGWLIIGKPLWSLTRWLHASPELVHNRVRARFCALTVCALVACALIAVPVPQRTYASALVWLPDNALVRIESDGVIERFLVADGDMLEAGAPIALLSNERLHGELAQVEAEITSHRVDQVRRFRDDAQLSLGASETYRALQRQREVLITRIEALTVRAGTGGRIAIDPGQYPPGRFVRQGTILAHVIADKAPIVRALVRNEDIALVREHPGAIRVEVALADRQSLPARLGAGMPRATRELPSAAMSMEAGGSIEVETANADQVLAKKARFAFDLMLDSEVRLPAGTRALAVFDHGSTSLAGLIERGMRETFLRYFAL